MTALPAPDPRPRRLIHRSEAPHWDRRSIHRRARAAVVWIAALFVLAAGVRSLVDERTTIVQPVVAGVDQALLAEATDVVTALYTWDAKDPAAYRSAVAELATSTKVDRPLLYGWDGKGTSTVTDVTVIGWSPVDNGLVVTVQARIGGHPRVLYVPVRRGEGNVPVLDGLPTWGAAPIPGSAPAATWSLDITEDPAVTDAARPAVEGFLRAWGANDPVAGQYAADKYQPTRGPDMRLVSVEYRVPQSGGDQRQFLAVVRWADTEGRTYPSNYLVTITRAGGPWRVAGLGPAPSSDFLNTPTPK